MLFWWRFLGFLWLGGGGGVILATPAPHRQLRPSLVSSFAKLLQEVTGRAYDSAIQTEKVMETMNRTDEPFLSSLKYQLERAIDGNLRTPDPYPLEQSSQTSEATSKNDAYLGESVESDKLEKKESVSSNNERSGVPSVPLAELTAAEKTEHHNPFKEFPFRQQQKTQIKESTSSLTLGNHSDQVTWNSQAVVDFLHKLMDVSKNNSTNDDSSTSTTDIDKKMNSFASLFKLPTPQTSQNSIATQHEPLPTLTLGPVQEESLLPPPTGSTERVSEGYEKKTLEEGVGEAGGIATSSSLEEAEEAKEMSHLAEEFGLSPEEFSEEGFFPSLSSRGSRQEDLACLIKDAALESQANTTVPAKSLLGCRSICLRSSKCQFFTFSPSRRTCLMIEQIGMLRRKTGTISGPVKCTRDSTASSPSLRALSANVNLMKGCVAANTGIRGEITKTINNVESVDECHNECLGLSTCQFFSFSSTYKKCFLYGDAFGTEKLSEFVAGPRECPNEYIEPTQQTSTFQLGPLVPLNPQPTQQQPENYSELKGAETERAEAQVAVPVRTTNQGRATAASSVTENSSGSSGTTSASSGLPTLPLVSNVLHDFEGLLGGLLRRPTGESVPRRASTTSQEVLTDSDTNNAVKKVEGMGIGGAALAGGTTAADLASIFQSARAWMSAGDTVLNTLPVSDLIRLGYKVANNRHWRKALKNIGPDKELATGPPVGMPNPEVTCMSEGMRCCVPRLAAPKYQNDPPKLNGVDDPRCVATYISADDHLCSTVKYNERICGTQTVETTTMFMYRNVMAMPSKTMNDALCECTVAKNNNNSNNTTSSAGGEPAVNGSAKWQYSLVAAEADEEKREKNAENVKRFSKGAKTALEFLEAVTGGENAQSAGHGTPAHFVNQLISIADDVNGLATAAEDGTGSPGVQQPQQQQKQPQDNDDLNKAVKGALQMITEWRQERKVKPGREAAQLRKLLDTLENNFSFQAQLEEEVEKGSLPNPIACTAWRRSCEESVRRLLFDEACQPVKVIEGGCPVQSQVMDMRSSEGGRVDLILALPASLALDDLTLACDFLFVPKHMLEEGGGSSFPLCHSGASESVKKLVERTISHMDGWTEVRTRGPLLDIILRLFPEPAVAEGVAMTIMKVREALELQVNQPAKQGSGAAKIESQNDTTTTTTTATTTTTTSTTGFEMAPVLSMAERRLLGDSTLAWLPLDSTTYPARGKGFSAVFAVERTYSGKVRKARIVRSDVIQ